jgi:hypothetical protein
MWFFFYFLVCDRGQVLEENSTFDVIVVNCGLWPITYFSFEEFRVRDGILLELRLVPSRVCLPVALPPQTFLPRFISALVQAAGSGATLVWRRMTALQTAMTSESVQERPFFQISPRMHHFDEYATRLATEAGFHILETYEMTQPRYDGKRLREFLGKIST